MRTPLYWTLAVCLVIGSIGVASDTRKAKKPRSGDGGPNTHGHVGWKSTAKPDDVDASLWRFRREVENRDDTLNCWIEWDVGQIDQPVKPKQSIGSSSLGYAPGDASGPLLFNGGTAAGQGTADTVVWDPKFKSAIKSTKGVTIRSTAKVNVMLPDNEIETFILTAVSTARQIVGGSRIEYELICEPPMSRFKSNEIFVRWDASLSQEMSLNLANEKGAESIYIPADALKKGVWKTVVFTRAPVEYRNESISVQVSSSARRPSRCWLPALAPARLLRVVALTPASKDGKPATFTVKNFDDKKRVDLGQFQLLDPAGNKYPLGGMIEPGKSRTISVKGDFKFVDGRSPELRLVHVENGHVWHRIGLSRKSLSSQKPLLFSPAGILISKPKD